MPREAAPVRAPADLLDEGAQALGLALEPAARRRLLDYVALLARWNAYYNLTAVRDPSDMIVHHVLDALAIVPPLRARVALSGATVADIGSGAGVPALPLAIVEPGAHLVSIEPVRKKSAFQTQVCAELGLTNVEVLAERAQALQRPCDLVLSRAFAALADFVAAAAGLLGPRTALAAMKGRRAGLDDELRALPGGWQAEVMPLTVPFLAAERHLVLLRRAPA